MPKSVVAVIKTKPATVLEDYHRLMNLAGYQDVVDKTADTGAQGEHLLALLLPGVVDGALAARRRHPAR